MDTTVKQAGAIVVRTIDSSTEVLLILSKRKPQRRIFPKGHIEIGESAEEAAHRELMEEAGIKGEQIGCAGEIHYTYDGKAYDVVYYVYTYQYNVSSGEEGRDPAWYHPLEAYELLPSDELRELFRGVIENKNFFA